MEDLAVELKPLALLYCVAALRSATIMLALRIHNNSGTYSRALYQMQQWHMFFSLSIAGIIAGMRESVFISLCSDMFLQYCKMDSIKRLEM